MIFNSLDFALFLPVVFLLYWFIFQNNLKAQNLFLVAASYLFYGWWDYRFLSLIIFSTLVDFWVSKSLGITEEERKRKLLLGASIIVNLGFLGFFKYYNFFLDNFIDAFSFFGKEFSGSTLKIILPVGISFYTFQTLSYTIDVYRKKLKPTNDIVAFSAFVSFFPQLVAGPIERATNLLPQFYVKRTFDYAKAVDGLRQILWGLFKKVVVADNCAEYANMIFNNSADYSGLTLVLGAIFFAFQIYCDFSGYSDIAIGTSRLLGFDLKKNFAFPYFSRDIAEFWRRWHISLSTWFRDYLYIPLGGSRGSFSLKLRNVFAIFIVSGFWHGANWTFIFWGTLHALFYIPLLIAKKNRFNIEVVAKGKYFPEFRELMSMLFTFSLVTLAWIFFRADNLGHAFSYIGSIVSTDFFNVAFTSSFGKMAYLYLFITIVMTGFLILVEWCGRDTEYGLEKIGLSWRPVYRWSFYYLIIVCVFIISGKEQEFIYFQF